MFHLCEKFVLKLVAWELGAQIRGLLWRSKELKFMSGFFFSKSVPLEPYSPRNKYYLYFRQDNWVKTVLSRHFCRLPVIMTDVMLDSAGH